MAQLNNFCSKNDMLKFAVLQIPFCRKNSENAAATERAPSILGI